MGFELGRAKRNGKRRAKRRAKRTASLNHLQTRYFVSKCYLIYLWKHKFGTNFDPLYLVFQSSGTYFYSVRSMRWWYDVREPHMRKMCFYCLIHILVRILIFAFLFITSSSHKLDHHIVCRIMCGRWDLVWDLIFLFLFKKATYDVRSHMRIYNEENHMRTYMLLGRDFCFSYVLF